MLLVAQPVRQSLDRPRVCQSVCVHAQVFLGGMGAGIIVETQSGKGARRRRGVYKRDSGGGGGAAGAFVSCLDGEQSPRKHARARVGELFRCTKKYNPDAKQSARRARACGRGQHKTNTGRCCLLARTHARAQVCGRVCVCQAWGGSSARVSSVCVRARVCTSARVCVCAR